MKLRSLFVRCFATFSVALIFPIRSHAISGYTDLSWNMAVNAGDWTDAASWTGGTTTPTTSHAACFKGRGAYNISLSQNAQFGAFYAQSSGGALKIIFDLGSTYTFKGRNYDWANQFIVFGTSGTDIEFTSGKVSGFSCVNLGSCNNGPTVGTYKNNRFALSGSSTTFTCIGGKERTLIGAQGSNNIFEVLDGAKYYAGSGTIIGESIGNAATKNILRVSGAGSYYRTYAGHNTSSYNWLPKYGTENAVIIEDGGYFYSNSDSSGAANSIYIASDAGAVDNSFIVRGEGSRANLKSNVYHGYAGSDNLLAVTNGARMEVKYEFSVGASSTAKRNTALIADGGGLCSAYHIVVGDSAASSNALVVTGAGSYLTNTTYDITVGNNADYNTLRVADGAHLYVKRHFCVGGPANMKTLSAASTSTSARSTGNRAIFEGKGTSAYIHNNDTTCGYTDIGWAGTNNLFVVRDGASVTNQGAVRIGWYSDLATGNGAIVSNATLRILGGGLNVNSYGRNNFFSVMDGGKAVVNGDIFVGSASSGTTAASNGCLTVSGEGSLLTYASGSWRMYVGQYGDGNVVEIKDGASAVLNGQMYIGSSTASRPTTGNTLRLFNASLANAQTTVPLNIYKNSVLSFGGSGSSLDVACVRLHAGSELKFVFDEDGIAPLAARNPLQILDASFNPTVSKITVDATAFAAAGKRGRFNLIKTASGGSCETADGVKLSSQSAETIAAANKALMSRIVCIPAHVRVTAVNLEKSVIEVTVPRTGFSIILK